MRKIEYDGSFRRDLKRERRGRYRDLLNIEFDEIVMMLCQDEMLPSRYRDHALTGNRRGYRDLHVRPDLVLIYRKVDDRLQLVRLGSHGELRL